jgi:hypothetical protein
LPDDIEAIVRDMETGLRFIRSAEGYGALVVEIQVRPHGTAQWRVIPAFSRKPPVKVRNLFAGTSLKLPQNINNHLPRRHSLQRLF